MSSFENPDSDDEDNKAKSDKQKSKINRIYRKGVNLNDHKKRQNQKIIQEQFSSSSDKPQYHKLKGRVTEDFSNSRGGAKKVRLEDVDVP